MGNKQIKETIDKHQELNKQFSNEKIKQNLVVFNIPITFIRYRQTKSYINQIINASNEELNNITYNELYLTEQGIKITNDNVEFWNNNNDDIAILNTHDSSGNQIMIYKHFDWNDEPVPEIISTHVENIIELQNQIKEFENKISTEKSKILELEYVQSKLNRPIEKTKTSQYIQTVKYLSELCNL
jgi:hypothetical protein